MEAKHIGSQQIHGVISRTLRQDDTLQHAAQRRAYGQSQAAISEQAAEIVNALFTELSGVFPAWKYAFPDHEVIQQAKKAWTKGFIENGILSMQQVQVGLTRARRLNSPHIPSVGQFIAWCRPTAEDLGLMPVQAAYRIACGGLQQLERGESLAYLAARIAARETGSFELRTRPESEMLPLFTRNYDIVCRRVMNGEDIQADIPKALPEQPAAASKPVPREEARRRMADLLKSVSASS
ncbi:replication protein P [Hahella sp. CR1]|uniref:replication protein P n=1 Tax=Hahella sp. CR1 TaxID=2992807 RepID=UPI0024434DA8|nr:replication protein P [Hahella sp. CR1]MDG9671845.1 replication protein P [Hahella sp. CR1]